MNNSHKRNWLKTKKTQTLDPDLHFTTKLMQFGCITPKNGYFENPTLLQKIMIFCVMLQKLSNTVVEGNQVVHDQK